MHADNKDSAYKAIVFDCMETLIQMDIPSIDVYSDWAYAEPEFAESGLWENEAEFRIDWRRARDDILADAALREGTVMGRLESLLRRRLGRASVSWSEDRIATAARGAHTGFWERYVGASYVLAEVPTALADLRATFAGKLGVASNFMVPGGISELLTQHDLARYFDFVVVSCDVGWRKPSGRLYDAVVAAAGHSPEHLLFVGDDPEADYDGPLRYGFTALLYDRSNRHTAVARRIRSLAEIATIAS